MATEQVEYLRINIERQIFTKEILKAFSYVTKGYRTYPNLNLKLREFDMEDTTFKPNKNAITIINTVFPYIEDLALNMKEREFSKIMTRHLNKFKRLETLEIKLEQNLKFKGPLLNLKKLIILGDKGDESSLKSILEKVEKYTYLTLRECLLDRRIITILRYENIKYLQLQNVASQDEDLYENFVSFIRNCKLSRIELVDTTLFQSLGKKMIKTYLENKFHEDLEEITFSVINEHIELSNFIDLKKLKRITIYFCLFTNPDIESIVIPLLINFPKVRFELREYFLTSLVGNPTVISPEEYFKTRDELLDQLYMFDTKINFTYVKDPFLTLNAEEIKRAKKTPFPFPRKNKNIRQRLLSIDSGSTIPIEEFIERLKDISDSSEDEYLE